jgi:hypothetical protein
MRLSVLILILFVTIINYLDRGALIAFLGNK